MTEPAVVPVSDPLVIPASTAPAAVLDSAAFRAVLGNYPTGVTAICSRLGDGTPIGLAANSFTSVSLEPPLVSFCIATTSSTWEQMQHTGAFAVSILAAGQGELCRQLSRKGIDRFADVAWNETPSGQPVIDGAMGWFDCTTWARHPAGDHEIVIGHVEAFGASTEPIDPLLFFRSQVRDL